MASRTIAALISCPLMPVRQLRPLLFRHRRLIYCPAFGIATSPNMSGQPRRSFAYGRQTAELLPC